MTGAPLPAWSRDSRPPGRQRQRLLPLLARKSDLDEAVLPRRGSSRRRTPTARARTSSTDLSSAMRPTRRRDEVIWIGRQSRPRIRRPPAIPLQRSRHLELRGHLAQIRQQLLIAGSPAKRASRKANDSGKQQRPADAGRSSVGRQPHRRAPVPPTLGDPSSHGIRDNVVEDVLGDQDGYGRSPHAQLLLGDRGAGRLLRELRRDRLAVAGQGCLARSDLPLVAGDTSASYVAQRSSQLDRCPRA